jgi:RIO-like serine/threonine protein kinase
MYKIIKDNHRVRVVFDAEGGVYHKVFKPTLRERLRYFSGLADYPGQHFARMAEILQAKGVATPRIRTAEHYLVVTEDIGGTSLREALLKADAEEMKTLLDLYTGLLAKLFQAGIFFADFHYNNFMIKGTTLYALDLDNYRVGPLASWRSRRLLRNIGKKHAPSFAKKLQRRASRKCDEATIALIAEHASAENILALLQTKLRTTDHAR